MSVPPLFSLINDSRWEQALRIAADHHVCRCYLNGYYSDSGERVPGPTCIYPHSLGEGGQTVPNPATFQPADFKAIEDAL